MVSGMKIVAKRWMHLTSQTSEEYYEQQQGKFLKNTMHNLMFHYLYLMPYQLIHYKYEFVFCPLILARKTK